MKNKLLRSLTWDDLNDWAGGTVVNRGEAYVTRVHDLANTDENHLTAAVHGQQVYRTEVWYENESLTFQCTCPYSYGPCKHSVALILVYLNHVKTNVHVPTGSTRNTADSGKLSDSSASPDEAEIPKLDAQRIREAFSRISKEDLIEWVTDSILSSSRLRENLPEGISTTDLQPDSLTMNKKQFARLQKMIDEETSIRVDYYERDEWYSYDDDYDNFESGPCYEEILKEFEFLAQYGLVSELMTLGKRLLVQSGEQLSESDPGYEVFEEIKQCMRLIFKTMLASDLPNSEKIIAYWEMQEDDQCNLTSDVPRLESLKNVKPADWQPAAKHFSSQLKKMPRSNRDENRFNSFRRNDVLQRAVTALKNAGDVDDAIELSISELPLCGNYEELVDLLIEVPDFDKAKQWILRGLEEGATSRDMVFGLTERMLKIAVLEENWPQATSIAAYFFADRATTLEAYLVVKDFCQRTGDWVKVREILLGYLETGDYDVSAADWPLVATGMGVENSVGLNHHPNYRVLIEIAIEEKRNDDAVNWIRQAPEEEAGAVTYAPQLQGTHPDFALQVWKLEIDALIGEVKAKSYISAMHYLKQIRNLLGKSGRSEEYKQYVVLIREKHRRKPLLLKELNKLERNNKRILAT